MLQTSPGACIAGKPAPTTAHKPLANAPICPCGSRLAGDASDIPGRLHRWQASSHKCTQAMGQCINNAHVGAGLPVLLQTKPGACIAGKPAPTSAHKPWANAPICPCGSRLAGDASDTPQRLHRWQASSHNCTQALRQCPQYTHVGAGLPAMLQTNPGDCIAGKPAPTSAHKPWANTPRGSRLAGDGCPGCMLSLPASAQRGVYIHQ